METVILLLLIVILVLVWKMANSPDKKSEYLELRQRLQQIAAAVDQLQESLKQPQTRKEESPVTPKPDIPATREWRPPPKIAVPEKVYTPPVTPTYPSTPVVRKEIPVDGFEEEVKEAPETWFSKNPDLEKFIGENLINKIGIGVLVLGISFFVKYAIDKDWINEGGRVGIGLLCGGILIGIAHYIRNSYRSFSSVLVGGGLSVFYFTVAYAFHTYALIGQQPAFIIMVLISALGVALAIFYDRIELAIIATIGGFATPFMVSTGSGNYMALFTYIAILNTGLMALAWFRRWPAINIIALISTTIIVATWMVNRTFFNDDPFPYRDGFLFASLFYVQFMVMSFINNLKLRRKFAGIDYLLALAINVLYFSAAIIMLSFWEIGNVRGIFSFGLGAVNLLIAWIYSRTKNRDTSFVQLLLGLGRTFVSLAGPLHFKGNAIALFWAAESVLLIWLYQKNKIEQLRISSYITLVLMCGMVVANMVWQYSTNLANLPILLNRAFITTLCGAAALLLYRRIHRNITDPVANSTIHIATLLFAIVFLYLAGAGEVYYQLFAYYDASSIALLCTEIYTAAFILVLGSILQYRKLHRHLEASLTIGFCILYFILRLAYNPARDIQQYGPQWLFSLYWLLPLLTATLLYRLISYTRQEMTKRKQPQWYAWGLSIAVIYLVCQEGYQALTWFHAKDLDWRYWQNLYFKAGVSIIWSACSFVMMWLGMKHNYQPLRIISLSLFSVTLIKLFGYDIQNMPAGGKIAAFILLGVMLLVVSFMYQRLKKLLIDNKPEELS